MKNPLILLIRQNLQETKKPFLTETKDNNPTLYYMNAIKAQSSYITYCILWMYLGEFAENIIVKT